MKAAKALATPSDPQSAETTSTSPGSGSPHGWLWSSMTSTLALAATSLSTVCEPMKPAPPVTATRTFVAAPLPMTREHTRVFTLCRVARVALVHDIAGVAAIQAQLLREAGHEVDRISLPQIGASWSWPAKAITIPIRLLAYIPAVSRLRRGRYDVIHIHWLTQGIVGLLVGAPFFVQAHGSDLHVNLQNRALRWLTRRVLRKAKLVFYVTPNLLGYLSGFEQKARYLPNPVEVDVVAPNSRPQSPTS